MRVSLQYVPRISTYSRIGITQNVSITPRVHDAQYISISAARTTSVCDHFILFNGEEVIVSTFVTLHLPAHTSPHVMQWDLTVLNTT